MAHALRVAAVLIAASLPLLSLAFLGCEEDGGPTAVSSPVGLPETSVVATRMDENEEGVRHLFLFAGSSLAAAIDGFEWQLGAPVAVDGLERAPAEDAWVRNDGSELELRVSFDAVASDGSPVDEPGQMARTLWVRARDVGGRVDPTPSRVTMTAQSIAPEVVIDFPEYLPTTSCLGASRVQTFGWTASDPDLSVGELETRYILFPVGGASDPCLTYVQYQQTMPIAADDPRWSNWTPFDAEAPLLDPSRSVTFPSQNVGDSFLFAVQARDASGATTISLQWGVNVRHFRVTDGKFPLLKVYEPSLGMQNFVSSNGLKSYEVLAGHELEFSWVADATNYVGFIVGYRYGWDLVDPEDPLDPGWAGPWGSVVGAPARAFGAGSHNFVVQAIDNSGGVSRASYLLTALRVPGRAEQRDLLVVFDWPVGGTPSELAVRDGWLARWREQIGELVFDFDARRDLLDAQAAPERLNLSALLDHRAVVWFVGASEQSFLHTRFAPLSSADTRYNWLEAYQREGGNILLSGPSAAYAAMERNPPQWRFPIIFEDSELGDCLTPDGVSVPRATLRWPYTGWCLSALDLVRPPLGWIFGETSQPLRQLSCDQLARAEVSADFLARHPAAAGSLSDLLPTQDRLDRHPMYQLSMEEFYDVNVTVRNTEVFARDCQVPMFVHRALRDEGYVQDPSLCPPQGSLTSVIDGAPIAIESAIYSDSKPLLGSHDFLWGFHPLGFEEEGLRAALRWVFLNDWELATAKR